jgi:hypothetical protein
MAPKLTTIKQILNGGENIPRTMVVSGKDRNFWFLVNQVSVGKDGNIVVNGVRIDSNEQKQLNQDTEVFHIFAFRRSKNERLSL